MSSSNSSTAVSRMNADGRGRAGRKAPAATTPLSPTATVTGADRRVKVVLVGNAFVGKTSMLFAYIEGTFKDTKQYQSTIFDNYAVTVIVDGRRVTLNLFDTAGQEDYAHLRVLSYPNTNVFLLCFSMVDHESLEACQQVWMPEIRKHVGGDAHVLLVGTKEDLASERSAKQTDRVRRPPNDPNQGQPPKRVELKMAQRYAQEMGCRKFLTCSSLTHRGLKRVFDEALLLALHSRRHNGGYRGVGPNATGSIDSDDLTAKTGCCGSCSVM